MACVEGHSPIEKSLLEKGSDQHLKDIDGQTAFHLACRGGYVEVVELLVSKGADINAKDNDGKTALQIAKSEVVE